MNLTTFLQETRFVLEEKRTLHQQIWKKDKLIPEVKVAMKKVADAFITFVDEPNMKVVDILMTGSLANYTWHNKSDVDLHILVDVKGEKCEATMLELFNTKRLLWNNEHNITIKGFPVELYVQPLTEEHSSSGVYSLTKNDWLVEPKRIFPSINDSSVMRKANIWKSRIDDLIKNKSIKSINSFKERLRDIRQMSLDRDGEFAIENLAFKILRNDGYIKKLYDCAVELGDATLTL